MRNKILIFVITFLGLSSCEKILFEKDFASFSPRENFEYLWKECDEKYTFFELKKVNWDSVYNIYSPAVYEEMSNDSLFNVMGGMLTALEDDHTNLISGFNISSFRRKLQNDDNFEWRAITDNYIGIDYYTTGPFAHDFIDGTNKRIGYIRFASFTGGVSIGNLNYILDRYRNTLGLVIDLRENGGGATTDIFSLLSHFTDQRTLLYYSRLKNGPSHNDFTQLEAAYVEPTEDHLVYLRPVMLLTDRGTYSAGSFVSVATKAIEHITLIGDTTGGGLGLPNGGQLPNGWSYRFSMTQTLDINQNNYENGVPPDIYMKYDATDPSKDEILEKAISEIYKAYN